MCDLCIFRLQFLCLVWTCISSSVVWLHILLLSVLLFTTQIRTLTYFFMCNYNCTSVSVDCYIFSFYRIYNFSFFTYFHTVFTFYLLRCLCLLIRSNLQYNICERLSRGKLILTSWILILFRFVISLYRAIYLY